MRDYSQFIHHNSMLFQAWLRALEHENHCAQMLQEGKFTTEVELQAVASFLQVPFYLYPKCPPHTTWIWYRHTPAALPDNSYSYLQSGRNFPLPVPANYHIEMCHTGLIHFDRIIPLNSDLWEDYLSHFPTLSRTVDSKVYSVE